MPRVPIRGRCGARILLALGYVEGRMHLPVVELKRVA